MVKNPPARGHGFDPWSGKIPHATKAHASQLLSLHTLEPGPCNKRSPRNERPAHRN